MWLEGLESVVKLLVGENVSLDGEYVSMPPRTVVPRCVQQPHPPLWMAGTSPSTTERAAAAGLGVLFFAHGILPESLAESVEAYRNRITSAEPIGLEVNNRLAGFCNALCLEDDQEARELGGHASFNYVMKGMSLATMAAWRDPAAKRMSTPWTRCGEDGSVWSPSGPTA